VEARRVISGRAATWLRDQRDGLNLRVRLARHRGLRTDPALLTAWFDRLLPDLCAQDASDDLLLATFELVLLLAGRGRLPLPHLAADDAQGALLLALPHLSAVCSQRPALLAAFSNAAGNLGANGLSFVTTLPRLAACCPAEHLLDAGVVLAWRSGEARLHDQALAIAARLPAAVVAVALAIDTAGVASSLAALKHNGWRRPGQVRQPGALLTRIGDYHGLGGPFAGLPEILDSSHGHCLHLRCGATTHHLQVDAFGWHCQPAAAGAARVSQSRPQPTFHHLLDGARSWIVLPSLAQPQVLICSRKDSFRLSVFDLEAG
jgi:hypothetical protein